MDKPRKSVLDMPRNVLFELGDLWQRSVGRWSRAWRVLWSRRSVVLCRHYDNGLVSERVLEE